MNSLPGGFHIPLNNYTLNVLKQPGIRLRSASLTVSRVCISFSKETSKVNCEGMLGIVRNLNNITAADSFGKNHCQRPVESYRDQVGLATDDSQIQAKR